jgi:hypothetical protein
MDLKLAQQMAEQSGNSFQCEVANHFKQKGWTVLLSPYYVDPMTDKTRELDMIVERHVDLPPSQDGSPHYGVKVRLFIECKYILEGNGYVFWLDAKSTGEISNLLDRTGHGVFGPRDPSTQQHHYLYTAPAAKLMTGGIESNVDKGYKADSTMSEALNQCLHGFVRNRDRAPLTDTPRNTTTVVKLDFPVIMCSKFADRIFETQCVNPPKVDAITDSDFPLEVWYAYPHEQSIKREFFVVDIVDFTQIHSFLATAIEKDLKLARQILNRGQ